jgi:propionyl-CoA carboxylase alpha chain
MFGKILIANRGEIAVRIIKTCQRLAIRTVVVHSDADAGSLAVCMADEAVHIGPDPATNSYLKADRIIEAVRMTGAQAVHPGFGFLSESPSFAERLAHEKIAFIGPNPIAIEAMGDKITSKLKAQEAGVSVVPGHLGVIESVDEAVRIARQIGFPVMIKASAGGGGKGMRIAWSDEETREGFSAARNEARSSFGDERVFIEKFVQRPRHIEIQVLGDKHGNLIHLGERECSIQRRNQKVIEEAPSPFVTPTMREAMAAEALALARTVNYDSAGTVEFIVDKDRNFYFLEMNTRLQVEHPVTESITGIDLVEQMIRVAAGERLAITQSDVKFRGWAFESRLYAEDPFRGFLPSIGRLSSYIPPVERQDAAGLVRVDTGVVEGDQISMFYDPMIAKIITHAETRQHAADLMLQALDELHVAGIQDNAPFLAAVFEEEIFRSGDITTGYIQQIFPQGFADQEPTPKVQARMLSAAIYVHAWKARRAASHGEGIGVDKDASRTDWVALDGRSPHDLQFQFLDEPGTAEIRFHGAKARHTLVTDWQPGRHQFRASLDGEPFTVQLKFSPAGWHVRHRGTSATYFVTSPRNAELYRCLPEKQPVDTSRLIVSPMPGLVVAVHVETGQEVKQGQSIMVVEAMKMENVLRAERDGTVSVLNVKAGDSVSADDVLVEFA